MVKIVKLFCLLSILTLLIAPATENTRSILRVGTTGDYPPITLYNNQTHQFSGTVIDKAKKLAQHLSLNVIFVKTTWPTLSHDLLNNKFDIAMGGISATPERAKDFLLTLPVASTGKVPLVRCVDKDNYSTLAKINRSNVRVIENIGGTNMIFAKQHLPQAKLILIANNQEVFNALLTNKADVMITDSIEAQYRQSIIPGLCQANVSQPFTHEVKVYMVRKDQVKLLEKVNAFIIMQTSSRQQIVTG